MDKQLCLEEESILIYRECPDGIHITGFQGSLQSLEIPGIIEKLPVTVIEKKAFLNSKALRTAVLPETIREVGDWAFANCKLLETVIFPCKEVKSGQQMFSGAVNLRRIYIRQATETPEERKRQEQVAALLAAAFRMLKAEYFLQPLEAGSSVWLRSFDERMLTVLCQRDEEMLKELVFCAEEDIEEKQEEFLKEQHRRKAELAFLRLHHSIGLSGTVKEYLQQYILERTKGCQSESAWDALRREREEQIAYAGILLNAGGVHDRNFADILADLGSYHTELKAYLLNWWNAGHSSGETLERFWEESFSI